MARRGRSYPAWDGKKPKFRTVFRMLLYGLSPGGVLVGSDDADSLAVRKLQGVPPTLLSSPLIHPRDGLRGTALAIVGLPTMAARIGVSCSSSH